MKCRDFLYWLQGAYETHPYSSNVIGIENKNIIDEHIKLAKESGDDGFLHQVEIIESMLHMWLYIYNKSELVRAMNDNIRNKLKAFFVKITEDKLTYTEKTFDEFTPALPEGWERPLFDFEDQDYKPHWTGESTDKIDVFERGSGKTYCTNYEPDLESDPPPEAYEKLDVEEPLLFDREDSNILNLNSVVNSRTFLTC